MSMKYQKDLEWPACQVDNLTDQQSVGDSFLAQGIQAQREGLTAVNQAPKCLTPYSFNYSKEKIQ